MMNLINFEDYMDRVIFERGLYYYKQKYVLSLENIGEYAYEAKVAGKEYYKVEVELDEENNIVEMFCDCPYVGGPHCKHHAAVLLAVREKEQIPHGDLPQTASSRHFYVQPDTEPVDTEPVDLEAILSKRTKEELVAFLMKMAIDDDEIENRIVLYFDESADDLQNKAISLIQKYPYISNGTVKGAELILEKAGLLLEQDQWVRALELTLLVIKEMIDLLDHADDSDGFAGEVLNTCFGIIRELVQSDKLTQSVKEELFCKLMQEVVNKRYDGWTEWKLELLESCSILSVTPDMRSHLEKALLYMIETVDNDSWSSSYLKEHVHLIRYSLVQQHEGQAAAQVFLEKHLQYSSLRKKAIEKAMRDQDYNQVIELALEGESNDKEFMGRVNNWKQYRYEAYKLSGQLEEQRALATDFIFTR